MGWKKPIIHAMTSTDRGAMGVSRRLAGVDGCPAGWIVALSAGHEGPHRLHVCETFRDVLALVGDSGIVVADIPIGLLDERQPGGRCVDMEARRMLGPRRSSVFSPPIRPALACKDWEAARKFGLTLQGFAIMPKIRDVDQLMTPALQRRVIESHPEVTFRHLAGVPMGHNKKRSAGRQERLRVLAKAASIAALSPFAEINKVFDQDRRRLSRKEVALDDIIDAYVMLFVAARYASGRAERIPPAPPADSRGLRMEMWL